MQALQPIHASKVAHGDLSPENILVEDSGKVWQR
jgi:tRNA A-37 threonylcarbamoyl transferase component Bud32